jgi:hypothetical protein
MARDEKEREKRRQGEKGLDEKGKKDKGRPDLTIKSRSMMPANRIRATQTRNFHEAPIDDTSSRPPIPFKSQPRLLASTSHLDKSIQTVSENTRKKGGGRWQTPFVSNLRLPPIPPSWRPTPTKASILREAAIKSAKQANLNSSLVKPIRGGNSTTKGTGYSFPKASPSRSLVLTPEKELKQVHAFVGCDPRSKDIYHEDKDSLSGDALDFSVTTKHQQDEDYPLSPPRFASRADDHCSSAWSADSTIRRRTRHSNTSLAPGTNGNEDFSFSADSTYENGQSRESERSISTTLVKNLEHEVQSSLGRGGVKYSSSSSGQPLVESPPLVAYYNPSFESFDTDDEYHGIIQDTPVQVVHERATFPRYSSSKEIHTSLVDRVCATPFHKVSSRTRKPRGSLLGSQDEPCGEDYPSKVKPILTVGRAEGRRARGSDTRESIKSVRWDPAIIAVGQRISPGTRINLEPTQPSIQEVPAKPSKEPFSSAMLDEYLNNVTQSFAKLKKANPKVINQILAALRELKSDDESNTDTECLQQERPNTKAVSEIEFLRSLATNGLRRKTTRSQSSNRATKSHSIGERRLSVTEDVKICRIVDAIQSTNHNKTMEEAKKDKRWGEVHPSVLLDLPSKVTDSQLISAQTIKLPVSHANSAYSSVPISADTTNLSSTFKTTFPNLAIHTHPVPESNKKIEPTELSDVTRLNPLAPEFRDLSGLNDRSNQQKRDDPVASQTQPRQHETHLDNSWRNAGNDYAPSETPATIVFHPGTEEYSIPQRISLDWKEQIGVNTSKSPWIDLTYGPREICTDKENGLNLDIMTDVPLLITPTPILTQPHIFKVPLGFIPLVPHPNFVQVPLQNSPAARAPVLLSGPLILGPEDIVSDDRPCDDEHGRVAQRLEQAWSNNLLARFQARYPMTGTRGSPPAPDPTSIDSTHKINHLNMPQIIKDPVQKHPVAEKSNFKAQTSHHFKGPYGAHPQKIARRMHASEIQQALEIKILEYKEKKAVEKKELERRLVENVAKSACSAGLRRQSQPDIMDGVANSTQEPSKIQLSDPEWIKTIGLSSKNKSGSQNSLGELLGMPRNQSIAQIEKPTQFEQRFLLQQVSKPQKRPWELLSVEEWRNQAITNLTSREANRRAKETSVASKISPDHRDVTIVSPWEVLSVEEWQNSKSFASHEEVKPILATTKSSKKVKTNLTLQKISGNCQSEKDAAVDKDSWELLSAEEWRSQASGKSHMAKPEITTTKNVYNDSFRAPKYLWEFLELDFTLEDLQKLSFEAYNSSRTSSRTASEALSEALVEARKRLALPELEKPSCKDCSSSELLSNTALVEGGSVDQAGTQYQQIQMDFKWGHQASRSTVDISLDHSGTSPGESSNRSQEFDRKFIVLTEGSAADYPSKGKVAVSSSQAPSASTELPSDFKNERDD